MPGPAGHGALAVRVTREALRQAGPPRILAGHHSVQDGALLVHNGRLLRLQARWNRVLSEWEDWQRSEHGPDVGQALIETKRSEPAARREELLDVQAQLRECADLPHLVARREQMPVPLPLLDEDDAPDS